MITPNLKERQCTKGYRVLSAAPAATGRNDARPVYEFDFKGRHYVIEDHSHMGMLPMTEDYEPADRYPAGWFAALRWFSDLDFEEREAMKLTTDHRLLATES